MQPADVSTQDTNCNKLHAADEEHTDHNTCPPLNKVLQDKLGVECIEHPDKCEERKEESA